jgi:hypothetical protein
MTDSITPRSLNEQTKVANLDEAKEAIQSIEAQLLELKSCIRSIEAVEPLPQYTPEQLRALARKFFVLGAERQADNVSYNTINPSVEVSGDDGSGFSWGYRGEVEIDGFDLQYCDPIEFDDVVITDEEIDEVVKQESDKTQVGQ